MGLGVNCSSAAVKCQADAKLYSGLVAIKLQTFVGVDVSVDRDIVVCVLCCGDAVAADDASDLRGGSDFAVAIKGQARSNLGCNLVAGYFNPFGRVDIGLDLTACVKADSRSSFSCDVAAVELESFIGVNLGSNVSAIEFDTFVGVDLDGNFLGINL